MSDQEPRLLIYRIVTDEGHAPHIADGYLTLTICKPVIRNGANVGDYVLALVANSNPAKKWKTVYGENKYFLAAYLFRVDEIVPMEKYEDWCKTHSPSKICNAESTSGDCQYGPNLAWRPGPHNAKNKVVLNKLIKTNLSGKNSIISRHYAAWTSNNPHVLDPLERAALDLNDDAVKRIGVGQTFHEFSTDEARLTAIAKANELITEWKHKNNAAKKGGRKTRRATKPAQQRHPASRRGRREYK